MAGAIDWLVIALWPVPLWGRFSFLAREEEV